MYIFILVLYFQLIWFFCNIIFDQFYDFYIFRTLKWRYSLLDFNFFYIFYDLSQIYWTFIKESIYLWTN